MSPSRFQAITGKYPHLRIAVLGDFCLDRYLEIDPEKQEISIETGLAVHNVVNVRNQPGGAGTILNNLVALTPGRYVGATVDDDEDEPFEERFPLLEERLAGQFREGRALMERVERVLSEVRGG